MIKFHNTFYHKLLSLFLFLIMVDAYNSHHKLIGVPAV